MRFLFKIGFCLLSVLSMAVAAEAQSGEHLNPMITLHEKGLPVFGISHPAIASRGGGGRGRGVGATTAAAAGSGGGAAVAAAPGIVLADVARETVAYKRADYQYASGTSDTFLQYIKEITAAGGSAHTHPFLSKIPIWHRDPEAAAQAAYRQLNAGHAGIMMQSMESADELRAGIAALRFKSAGGTRPDEGIDAAAAYWGLSPQQYRQKADVWPLNKTGELIVWAIIESTEGLAHVREIAAVPGLGVMWAGWGTLGGVFNGDPAGRDAAAQKILAACKEFKVPCGFPVNNPAEVTARMAEGWSVFVMQSRNDAAYAAIETGRKLGGR